MRHSLPSLVSRCRSLRQLYISLLWPTTQYGDRVRSVIHCSLHKLAVALLVAKRSSVFPSVASGTQSSAPSHRTAGHIGWIYPHMVQINRSTYQLLHPHGPLPWIESAASVIYRATRARHFRGVSMGKAGLRILRHVLNSQGITLDQWGRTASRA